MRKDREQALKMRFSGKSYQDIQRALGVPKSTLSGWFSNLILSQDIRDRINSRGRKQAIAALLVQNKRQTVNAIRRSLEIRKTAKEKINNLSKNDIFLLGLALYWAEGYKRVIVRNGKERTSHPISLTNADPKLVKVFVRFLRESLNVPLERIKANIRIYQHQNEKHLQSFWHSVTGIPLTNFRKTYYGLSRSSQGKRPYNRLPYGVIQIVVADTKLFHAIMGSLEGIQKRV